MNTTIHIGNAADVLRTLPAESVHCCVTSPPYWNLRAYGKDPNMIGLEDTFDEHLDNLMAVFTEVHRVLRAEGTFWLNYGDAYAGSGRGQTWSASTIQNRRPVYDQHGAGRDSKRVDGFKPKDLMLLPARIAMALQAAGWWLRSEIVWSKTNPMPESVVDRPTSAHEKVFLFSKRRKYYYDLDATRTPHKEQTDHPGANLRNVWNVSTVSNPEEHFAMFPPSLIEPCIKAGTSACGVCSVCGAPHARRFEVLEPAGHKPRVDEARHKCGSGEHPSSKRKELGWFPTCECVADVVPATVLDPFGGAGTTAVVANALLRDAVLIEINDKYARMAENRVADAGGMFVSIDTVRHG